MFHKHRTWCVAPVDSPEELAEKLARHTWCACNGFQLGDYLFLNDATGPDGAQEYAIVKQTAREDSSIGYRQIESITASWMTEERILEFVCQTLAGAYDEVDWACDVEPCLETSEQHGRCQHCA